MSQILVVTGSVRPNSVNSKIVPLVVSEVEKQGAAPVLVDLGELNLPFYDAPYSPTAPEFEPTNDAARKWTKLVFEADGVIFVTPEYNHTMSAVQMNAIDWIGKEWHGKHVGLVGYGWNSGARQAHATAREALEVVLKAEVGDEQTNLFFTREIAPDGSVLDADAVNGHIANTVSELIANIS